MKIMICRNFEGYDKDYVRVYLGTLASGFDSVLVERVENYRGPPGMIIYLKDNQILKVGPSRQAPVLGNLSLTKLKITEEMNQALAEAEVRSSSPATALNALAEESIGPTCRKLFF